MNDITSRAREPWLQRFTDLLGIGLGHVGIVGFIGAMYLLSVGTIDEAACLMLSLVSTFLLGLALASPLLRR